MKKFLLVVLIFVVMSGLLGCAGGGGDAGPVGPPTANARYDFTGTDMILPAFLEQEIIDAVSLRTIARTNQAVVNLILVSAQMPIPTNTRLFFAFNAFDAAGPVFADSAGLIVGNINGVVIDLLTQFGGVFSLPVFPTDIGFITDPNPANPGKAFFEFLVDGSGNPFIFFAPECQEEELCSDSEDAGAKKQAPEIQIINREGIDPKAGITPY